MRTASLHAVLTAAAVAALLLAAAPSARAQTYGVVGRVTAADAGDSSWDYTSFDPGLRRFYVSRADGVTAIDVDRGKMIGHFADGQRTHASLPLPGAGRLLVTNAGTNSARIVDALSGALVAEIPTAQRPDAAIYDPVSGLALVMSGVGEVSLIDPRGLKAAGSITVGGKLEFAATDGEGRVFVNVKDGAQIAVIDTGKRTVTARFPLAGCSEPGGLAYVRAAQMLVATCTNGVATFVDARDGRNVATQPIAAGADAVIVDEARGRVFIPCGRDAVLEVFDVSKPSRIVRLQSLKTEPGARTGALDPKTGRLYLPAAAYGPPAQPGGRPTILPNSFHVLIVAPG